MKRILIVIALFVLFLAGNAAAEGTRLRIAPSGAPGGPWSLSLGSDLRGDYLMIGSPREAQKFYMYQKDVTPSRFALTYNTLKDALMNDDSRLYIWYTGPVNDATIVRIQIAGE